MHASARMYTHVYTEHASARLRNLRLSALVVLNSKNGATMKNIFLRRYELAQQGRRASTGCWSLTP